MKGSKTLALLGGLAIVGSIHLSPVFASDSAAAGEKTPAAVNELDANRTDRIYSLDELFKSFNKPQAGIKEPANAIPASSNKMPSVGKVTTTTLKKAPGKKAIATTPIKQATKQATKLSTPSTLLATHTKQSNVLPVSHMVPSGSNAVITASLDHAGDVPKYHAGEQMTVKITAQTDCNVIVFDYDAENKLTQLYPNQYEPSGALRAGQTVVLGGPDSKYTLDIGGKGTERIFVYAYPVSDPQITVAMTPVPHTPFRSADITPEQYKELVMASKGFFSGTQDRSVTVHGKAGAVPASAAQQPESTAANKVELVFQIEK